VLARATPGALSRDLRLGEQVFDARSPLLLAYKGPQNAYSLGYLGHAWNSEHPGKGAPPS